MYQTQNKTTFTNTASRGNLMAIFSDEVYSQCMYEYQENKVAIIQHLNTADNREQQGIIYAVYGIDTKYMEIDWKISFPSF